ncbi:hypothetical protein BKA93DRAFT_926666 [Sparassis latifolia]
MRSTGPPSAIAAALRAAADACATDTSHAPPITCTRTSCRLGGPAAAVGEERRGEQAVESGEESRCGRGRAHRMDDGEVDMSSSAVGRASPRGASELQESNVEVGDVPDEGGVLAVAAGEAEEVLLAREAGMERASTLRALVAREGEAAGEGALAGAGVEDAVDALKGAEGEDAEVLDAGVRKLGGFVRNGCEKCAHGA